MFKEDELSEIMDKIWCICKPYIYINHIYSCNYVLQNCEIKLNGLKQHRYHKNDCKETIQCAG